VFRIGVEHDVNEHWHEGVGGGVRLGVLEQALDSQRTSNPRLSSYLPKITLQQFKTQIILSRGAR